MLIDKMALVSSFGNLFNAHVSSLLKSCDRPGAIKIFVTTTPNFEILVERWLGPSLRRLGPQYELHLLKDSDQGAHGNGDFRSAGFDKHVVNKFRMIAELARRESQPFFVSDADIVYLKPFFDLLQGNIADHDILLSQELHDPNGKYNVGQMFIRPSAEMALLFENVADELSRPDSRSAYQPEQAANQAFFCKRLIQSGLRHEALPVAFAHWGALQRHGPKLLISMISYHATNTVPRPGASSLDQKKTALENMARQLQLDLGTRKQSERA